MLILVINCGSSSVKYKLIDMQEEKTLLSGLAERIGLPGSRIKHEKNDGRKLELKEDLPDHRAALEKIIACITDKEYGAVNDVSEITAVGHRTVHGGEKFNKAILVNREVLNELESLFELAPLHNPPNVLGIKTCQELMPHAPQVAVFDTAFHQTIPDYAFTYALPYEYYEKYGIRKYGFHGTSHKYVSGRAAAILGKPLTDLKIVVCHLGNGSSITAVKNGISVDTTMGFTPLAGLPMGTRTGDIDPAVVPFIMEKENLSIEEVSSLMNKKSGVLGVSGISSDFRDLEKAEAEGNKRAELALNMFIYSVKKWIGAFSAAMGGLDAVVFTGGIGENAIELREKVLTGMDFLGLEVDKEKNNVRGKETIISKDGCRAAALVVPTNEELMIAKETQALV
ncbi:acetate kinase [Desulfohalotomaculum tongense]|uniref:acetate/propionate family kinase n=1 Tax=Desulforadius tongensis TaxID=1216062 RepID=UPI001A9CA2D7|nr:acetate kinase [Desulforadius tongensis]MBM7854406.1 acetate kinase [Desulforadius tongensis]